MAREDAAVVGLFGSGKQARTQIQAVCKVRKISRVYVYSPREENRRRFVEEMSAVCEVDMEPIDRPEWAAADRDIVITATDSREPVLSGLWLKEGTHLNVIGSNFLTKREVDTTAVRRCSSLVVDSKDQARLEAGDLATAIEENGVKWSDVHELGQVIVGRFKGRARQQDITMFKSLGIGLEDIAVAGKVYAKARELGVGRMIEW
jgi:ornithine cyclodeaminase/alanine dehydrogenase